MEQNTERRSYYRINDTVSLTFKVLDGDQVLQSADSENLEVPLTSLLTEIDREFNKATNILWHENPTIAQALGLLNRKLSIIAAHSLRDQDQSLDCYEEMMVNISGCGIAFDCSEPLEVSTRLELSLVLTPSNIQLQIAGEVIRCEIGSANPEKPYWVRVNFDDNSSAQEKLIQHIVQKQCAQIGSGKTAVASQEGRP